MTGKPTYEELEQRVKELNTFRTISDIAVHGNAIADFQGNIVYINDYFARVHGYAPDELIGKNLSIFHNEKQMETVRQSIESLIERGSYKLVEIWHTHKDGTEFPMLMSGTVILDESSKPSLIAASAIDITGQRLAQQALAQEKDKLQKALDEIKTLSGMLPICASCKKIRDDKGYWNQIESYIRDHSGVEFSHGICPDCVKKLYPYLDIEEKI